MTAAAWIDFGPGLVAIGCLIAAAAVIAAEAVTRRQTARARENLRRLPTRLRVVEDALDQTGDEALAVVFDFPPPVAPADGGPHGEFLPRGDAA